MRIPLVTILVGIATCALAGPASAEDPPRTSMVLKTVEHHAQETPPATKQTTLTCEPPGGRHPHPPVACDALLKAGGDIGRIPAKTGACPNIFAPVEATAVGEWRGHPVKFAITYPNRCGANRDSNDFFNF